MSGHFKSSSSAAAWTPYVYTDEYGFLDTDDLVTGDLTKWQAASALRIYGMNDHRDLCGRASFQTEAGWHYEAFVLKRVE